MKARNKRIFGELPRRQRAALLAASAPVMALIGWGCMVAYVHALEWILTALFL